MTKTGRIVEYTGGGGGGGGGGKRGRRVKKEGRKGINK